MVGVEMLRALLSCLLINMSILDNYVGYLCWFSNILDFNVGFLCQVLMLYIISIFMSNINVIFVCHNIMLNGQLFLMLYFYVV